MNGLVDIKIKLSKQDFEFIKKEEKIYANSDKWI